MNRCNRCRGVATWLLAILAGAGLILAGSVTAKSLAANAFPCVAEGKLDKTIAPEAELVEFSCVFKKYEGRETLHFHVAVKNVSSKDQRFKVNIFLDNGKAVGGLIPQNTKGGLVKPGQTAEFVYPVNDMKEKPTSVTLIIKTIGE